MLRFATLAILLIPSAVLNAADPVPAPAPEPDITGCWYGRWMSCTSNHDGPITANICKISDDCYQANFRGRFWAVFPFRYTATMQVTGREGDKIYLSSSRRLPLIGRFDMSAVVTPTDFTATYTSRDDHGQFIMKR